MLLKTLKFATLKIGLVAGVVAASILATTVHADQKPRPSKPITTQAFAKVFVGRVHIWKSCDGGIIFKANGEAVAYCPKKGKDAVAVGKWYLKRGTYCHKLTWYFEKGGALQNIVKPEKCEFQIVTDKDGQFWHSWPNDKEYWRGLPKDKHFTNRLKGANRIARLRRKFGV